MSPVLAAVKPAGLQQDVEVGKKVDLKQEAIVTQKRIHAPDASLTVTSLYT